MAKQKVVKEFNNGTMTSAAFFGMIRSALRNRSRFWKPITQCKNDARRKYKGANKRQRWEYQCNKCKKWFNGTTVSVDHIKPVGTLTKFEDLPDFVRNLFCEVHNLQCLCSGCHNKKTSKERKTKTKK